MSQTLPRLRLNLDFMPSPSTEHPGLFIRDPFRFSEAMLIIPPPLVECLECFDGEQTDLDLRAVLVRITNSLDVSEIEQNLVETLSAAGFLEDENFARMSEERRSQFAAAPVREAAHAGAAYPAEPGELRNLLAQSLSDAPGDPVAAEPNGIFAIAAPHVSPEGGWPAYRAAYRLLRPEHRTKTFIILATSHYGEPEKFGLTRKKFVTPLGEIETDTAMVDWLAARGGAAVEMEDYCHSFEHTVELQLIFLQQMLGSDIRIVPILCGSFAKSLIHGGRPEDDDNVKRFCEALGELGDLQRDRLFWVLGVDMAHMGARYQDQFTATAGQGIMCEVSSRDQARIERIAASDAQGFWELVRENRDDLKWCGSSPFYTFLKAAPKAQGKLLRYDQWNIDERSVVSFAGMSFSKPA